MDLGCVELTEAGSVRAREMLVKHFGIVGGTPQRDEGRHA